MSYQDIAYAVADRVATLRFNRPQALNALSDRMIGEISAAFDDAVADENVRVIVLTGEGRAFCAGADLADTTQNLPRDAQGRPDLGQILEERYNPLVLKMRAVPKPILAAVNGLAAGAGSSLALMADLTIAARSAYFLQAFVNIGLVPDAGGTWILPRNLGPQRALGLAWLGEKLPAEQAKAWGLIWDVVDDERLLQATIELAKRLADGPGIALARIKRAVHAAAENELPVQLQLERELQRECGATGDFVEGVAAFLQKRQPNFKNR